MTSRTRLHSLLWTGSVVVATALSLVLTLQVKAVHSDIAETEKAIVATKQQLAVLETEFQTRARQQQLVRWNEVEFGYVAPRADQFLDGRAELAALGKPAQILDAAPIRMAEAAAPAIAPGAETAAPVPVPMASAASAAKPAVVAPAKAEAPIRLAQAKSEKPAMMRQLVAMTDAKPVAKPVKSAEKAVAKVTKAEPKAQVVKVAVAKEAAKSAAKPATRLAKAEAAPRDFAKRFDLDSVIAEGKR